MRKKKLLLFIILLTILPINFPKAADLGLGYRCDATYKFNPNTLCFPSNYIFNFETGKCECNSSQCKEMCAQSQDYYCHHPIALFSIIPSYKNNIKLDLTQYYDAKPAFVVNLQPYTCGLNNKNDGLVILGGNNVGPYSVGLNFHSEGQLNNDDYTDVGYIFSQTRITDVEEVGVGDSYYAQPRLEYITGGDTILRVYHAFESQGYLEFQPYNHPKVGWDEFEKKYYGEYYDFEGKINDTDNMLLIGDIPWRSLKYCHKTNQNRKEGDKQLGVECNNTQWIKNNLLKDIDKPENGIKIPAPISEVFFPDELVQIEGSIIFPEAPEIKWELDSKSTILEPIGKIHFRNKANDEKSHDIKYLNKEVVLDYDESNIFQYIAYMTIEENNSIFNLSQPRVCLYVCRKHSDFTYCAINSDDINIPGEPRIKDLLTIDANNNLLDESQQLELIERRNAYANLLRVEAIKGESCQELPGLELENQNHKITINSREGWDYKKPKMKIKYTNGEKESVLEVGLVNNNLLDKFYNNQIIDLHMYGKDMGENDNINYMKFRDPIENQYNRIIRPYLVTLKQEKYNPNQKIEESLCYLYSKINNKMEYDGSNCDEINNYIENKGGDYDEMCLHNFYYYFLLKYKLLNQDTNTEEEYSSQLQKISDLDDIYNDQTISRIHPRMIENEYILNQYAISENINLNNLCIPLPKDVRHEDFSFVMNSMDKKAPTSTVSWSYYMPANMITGEDGKKIEGEEIKIEPIGRGESYIWPPNVNEGKKVDYYNQFQIKAEYNNLGIYRIYYRKYEYLDNQYTAWGDWQQIGDDVVLNYCEALSEGDEIFGGELVPQYASFPKTDSPNIGYIEIEGNCSNETIYKPRIWCDNLGNWKNIQGGCTQNCKAQEFDVLLNVDNEQIPYKFNFPNTNISQESLLVESNSQECHEGYHHINPQEGLKIQATCNSDQTWQLLNYDNVHNEKCQQNKCEGVFTYDKFCKYYNLLSGNRVEYECTNLNEKVIYTSKQSNEDLYYLGSLDFFNSNFYFYCQKSLQQTETTLEGSVSVTCNADGTAQISHNCKVQCYIPSENKYYNVGDVVTKYNKVAKGDCGTFCGWYSYQYTREYTCMSSGNWKITNDAPIWLSTYSSCNADTIAYCPDPIRSPPSFDGNIED